MSVCPAYRAMPALALLARAQTRWAAVTDYRLIMMIVGVLCGVAAISGIWPAVERAVSAVVVGALVGVAVAGCVAVVRRELRIRRRLAAIQPFGAIDRRRQRVGVPR